MILSNIIKKILSNIVKKNLLIIIKIIMNKIKLIIKKWYLSTLLDLYIIIHWSRI